MTHNFVDNFKYLTKTIMGLVAVKLIHNPNYDRLASIYDTKSAEGEIEMLKILQLTKSVS